MYISLANTHLLSSLLQGVSIPIPTPTPFQCSASQHLAFVLSSFLHYHNFTPSHTPLFSPILSPNTRIICPIFWLITPIMRSRDVHMRRASLLLVMLSDYRRGVHMCGVPLILVMTGGTYICVVRPLLLVMTGGTYICVACPCYWWCSVMTGEPYHQKAIG